MGQGILLVRGQPLAIEIPQSGSCPALSPVSCCLAEYETSYGATAARPDGHTHVHEDSV